MEHLSLNTTKRVELIDITDKIQAIVEKEKINEGLCAIFCPHTTAGLSINENADPLVRRDIINGLEKIVPRDADYSHREGPIKCEAFYRTSPLQSSQIAKGNADSHIKSSLVGSSLNIFIEDGKLQLGTWQGIYFCEFDGPRSRQVWIKIK